MDKIFGCGVGVLLGSRVEDGHSRVESIVRVEGGDLRRGVFGVVVGEFGKGK